MAIGPKQLNDTFKNEVDAFEKLIDGALLKKSISPGGKVMIDTSKGITTSHLIVLVNRYIVAGWKRVDREYGDQRDPGDWLVFES